MCKTIQYSVIFVILIVFISAVMGDAFDQTVAQIQALETELEQNRTLIEKKQTLIEQQLSTLREDHKLNAPKSQFESDEEYAARLSQLDTEISQRRTELEKQRLSRLLERNIEIQPQIARLYRRIFQTNDVTATLGGYNANAEFFPVTFEVLLNGENQRFNARLPINKEDARDLSDNWEEVIKTGWLSINPGYRRVLVQVKLEYPALWKQGFTWILNINIYDLGNNNSVAFSPDGRYIATGSNDEQGIATIWKVENGEGFRKIDHGDWVYAVAFSPDGKYFATAGQDETRSSNNGKAIVWDISKGTKVQTIEHSRYVRTVAFSPDSKYLATARLRSSNQGSLFLWRVRGEAIGDISYRANKNTIQALTFSPDGRYLATGNVRRSSTYLDGATFWPISNGGAAKNFEHKNGVYAVAFSPSGEYLVTGNNGSVTLWEISSGRSLRQRDLPNTIAYAVAFRPDGEFFAVGTNNGFIVFFQIGTEKITFETEITRVKWINTGSEVRDLAWHPSGNLISDGKKVYRTLLQPEEVSLASTTPMKTSGENQQEVPSAGLVNPSSTKLFSSAIAPVGVGATFTLNFTIGDVTDLAGWQVGVAFNPSVLSGLSTDEGNFLKRGDQATFFQKGKIDNLAGSITDIIGVYRGTGGVSGTGVLFSITFLAKSVGEGSLQLRDVHLGSPPGSAIPYEITLHPVIIDNLFPAWDVNEDGQVDTVDLSLVGVNFGRSHPTDPRVDVNGDGAINIFDMIVVAQHFGEGQPPYAPIAKTWPSPPPAQIFVDLNPKTVQRWIDLAYAANDGSIAFQLGITNLNRLLDSLIPEKTGLLANYPNPFNPETWIPYELADDADVLLLIYDTKGMLVRQFELGHQMAGYYTNRHRAVYWDGRSETGERVASGIYFYHLQVKSPRSDSGVSDFSSMRKMVIRK